MMRYEHDDDIRWDPDMAIDTVGAAEAIARGLAVAAQSAAAELDARVFVAIIDAILDAPTAAPGFQRGYALRSELAARLQDVAPDALHTSLCRVIRSGKVGHYYDSRDGQRLYLKGTR